MFPFIDLSKVVFYAVTSIVFVLDVSVPDVPVVFFLGTLFGVVRLI